MSEDDIQVYKDSMELTYGMLYPALLARAFFWPLGVAAGGWARFMPSLPETDESFFYACFFGQRTTRGLACRNDSLASKSSGGLNSGEGMSSKRG